MEKEEARMAIGENKRRRVRSCMKQDSPLLTACCPVRQLSTYIPLKGHLISPEFHLLTFGI
ncbi:hypothetical protein AMTR_s00037p00068970 [Amborella trichopoda]|uniref:Uncharacterized protein n=1 Tax=Amborella trichopoda TaxID=13333 RepID=U5CVF1_AMBTC|nr:hypothetical protein AMTR_s00037p00068970 [Amborella trichopoda]